MKPPRTPRWLAAAASMLARLEPSTPKKTAAPTKEDMRSVESEIEAEDAEIIADFNALSGQTFVDENGVIQHHITNELEATAHLRELKSWQDLDPEVVTSMEMVKLGERVMRQMVGEGYARWFDRADMNRIRTERALRAPRRKYDDPYTTQLVAMARAIRGDDDESVL